MPDPASSVPESPQRQRLATFLPSLLKRIGGESGKRRSNMSNSGELDPSNENLDSYQFTFNCTNSGSTTKDSFIEPDLDAEGDASFTDYSESLTDSVLNFPEEFGRTYHAYRAGSYVFPNDMPERERLQLQSDIILKTFGGNLFFAPIHNTSPRRILDIATGTGEWAIQMGDRFPQAQVIATDLSPIQPGEVPPNVNFYVEDSSEPWEYSHNFDFIHTRVTAGCWESFKLEVADQAFANLDPGGWFESHEYDADFSCDDDTLNPNGALMGWSHNMITAGGIVGRSLRIARYLKRDYEAAGFVDVQERIFKIPTNAWAKEERLKELGRMWEWNYSRGISAFSYGLFNRAFDLTREQIELDLVEVRKELSDPKIHAYVCLHAVWGRKPFPGEGATVQPMIQTG